MTGSQSHLAFAFGGPLAPVGTAIEHLQDCCISEGGARLHRPLKKSLLECFVSGHDFSRADKPFIFLPEPALAGGT
jgi:hypothetical protein